MRGRAHCAVPKANPKNKADGAGEPEYMAGLEALAPWRAYKLATNPPEHETHDKGKKQG